MRVSEACVAGAPDNWARNRARVFGSGAHEGGDMRTRNACYRGPQKSFIYLFIYFFFFSFSEGTENPHWSRAS